MSRIIDPAELVDGFVYLSDQQPLSSEERAAAERARSWIKDVLHSRMNRLTELSVDEAVGLPQARWNADREFYPVARLFTYGNVLDLLRIYGQHFTGFPLHCMGESLRFPEGEVSPESIDAYLAGIASQPDDSVLLYASLTDRLPDYLHTSPPCKFGEVGWKWRGKLVNHDTVAYLERLAILYEVGLLNRDNPDALCHRDSPTIVEIGSGYGGLASYLKQLVPQAHYIAVDLPESLAYSSSYLSALHHGQQLNYGMTPVTCDNLKQHRPGVTFVPNYEFSLLVEAAPKIDLCINTLSMSEMSEPQVQEYCAGINQLIGNDGWFFEQNQDNRHCGNLNAQDVIRPYFEHTYQVGGPTSNPPLLQGFANVWSNSPLPATVRHKRVFNEPMPSPTPQLLESINECNIVLYRNRYFCIPWSHGPVDFAEVDSETAGFSICDNLASARQAAAA